MSVVLAQPALHVSSISRKLACALLGCALVLPVAAKDVTISLPKTSKPTPVQKLNQQGVKELEKHNYKEAKKLFKGLPPSMCLPEETKPAVEEVPFRARVAASMRQYHNV